MALRGRPVSGSPHARSPDTLTVLVVGAGPAGLEGARTLARAGVPVRVVDRAERPGGLLRAVATTACMPRCHSSVTSGVSGPGLRMKG